MATKLIQQLSLLEIVNRTAPNGNPATIVEVMSKENEILLDIPFVQANGGHYHKDTIRTFVPKGQKRQFNKGVGNVNSKTEPVNIPIMMFENYSEVDKAQANASADKAVFRMGEAKAILEGLSQSFADAVFYGNNKIDPEESNGLATICNKLGDTVLDAGGSGANLTSIYIVQWDQVGAKGVYPKGSTTGGVVHNDLGEVTLFDDENKKYQGYRDHFQCYFGLAITDKKRVARIANIPTTGAQNISKLIIRALNKMKQRGRGAVIYGNSTALSYLDLEALDKATVPLVDAFGRPVTQFRPGNPLKLCEAILDTEERVVA